MFALSGCAVPTAVTIASFAADGVSYIATGKSTTDHALSIIAQEDCAMMRALKEEAICTPGGKLPVQTVTAEPDDTRTARAGRLGGEAKGPAAAPTAWNFPLVQKDSVSEPHGSDALQLVAKEMPARPAAAAPVRIVKRLRPAAPKRIDPPIEVGRIILARCSESTGMQPAAQCGLGPGV